MSNETPLTLMQLARQRLLREEALIISTLGDLPVELLPGIFDEAFANRSTNILRAMVCAWPFSCLHVGALIKMPCHETVQALLDGLDVLITQKLHPSRRSKLRVLDLTREDQDLRSMRARTHEGDCLPQIMKQKQPVEICSKSGMKKPFIVVTDMEFTKTGFSQCNRYMLHWAQQQKLSVYLCCRKLKVLDSPVFTAIEIFKIVHLDSILELEMSQWWLEFSAKLFPYLDQMRNLHTFVLEGNHKGRSTASEHQKWLSTLLTLFSKLPRLQNLHVNGIHFLTGYLEEWIRYMKMPLETLSVTDCQLSHLDFYSLGQCLNICELRHLNLSSSVLSDVCPNLLGILFERISSTLQTLEMEECEMEDAHFIAILPGLSQCSQLTQVNFYDNDISLCVLKSLLHHTAKLSKMKYELYPAPLECYEESRILKDKFLQLCPELLGILRSQRQPEKFYFSTRLCLNCFEFCYYDGDARLCLCEQAG